MSTPSASASTRPEVGTLLERLEQAFNNLSLQPAEREALQGEAKHFFEGSPVKLSIWELDEAWFNEIRERSRLRTAASETGREPDSTI